METASRLIELEAREADWELAPGRSIQGFTFNGEVPGPVIEVNVGETRRSQVKSCPRYSEWPCSAGPFLMRGLLFCPSSDSSTAEVAEAC